MNYQLLDCTLRDGGYINNWQFGNLTIRSVISRLDAAGLDYIEVGFLDERVEFNNERSIFPNLPSIAKTLGKLRTKQAKMLAMIDFGTFSEELLIPASESVISGIRLIFTKGKADNALEYAKIIKAKGYELFLNLVSTSSYSETELSELAEKINAINPVGVSVVDTYGLMFNTDMDKYVRLLDKTLNATIAIGYHSHNNLQMSNSNTVEFLKMQLHRDRIADSTILGMGKNAGNACTEFIAHYADKAGIKQIDIVQILECAYADIQKFQGSANWGYKLEYLLSAILDCSPNWTKEYMQKNTLSIHDIYKILKQLPDDKFLPTFFSKKISEELYLNYMDNSVNDAKDKGELSEILRGRELLLIFPGKTITKNRIEIEQYIAQKSPVVMSVNFISDIFKADYAFLTNSLRYSQMFGVYADLPDLPEIIVTSNIVTSDAMPPKFKFNFKTTLYDAANGAASAALVFRLLFSAGIKTFAVAGLDGFDSSENPYFDSGYKFSFAHYSNDELEEQLRNISGESGEITFITPSRFEKIFI